MRDIWHRKPLLIRQAVPGIVPPVSREALFELADRDDAVAGIDAGQDDDLAGEPLAGLHRRALRDER